MLEDLIHDATDHVHRDREADAVRAERLRQDGRVDADQLAVGVDERAAGIAEIDGGVGLNEIFEIRDAEPAASGGADDALRHRLTQSKRIADREHDVAGAHLVGSAHRHHRRVGHVHAQDGQVRIGVGADDGRRRDATVGKLDADLVRPLDDVMVRDEVAVAVDDDAGAEAALDPLTHVGKILPQQRVADGRTRLVADDAGSVDVDHGRSGPGDRVGERSLRLVARRIGDGLKGRLARSG